MSVINKTIISIAVAYYLMVALSVSFSNLKHDAIISGDESNQAIWTYNFRQGIPLYGPDDDPYVYNLWAYTPLAYQIMGVVTRLFDSIDIRLLRATVLLFSVGAMALVGLITYQLTRNKFFAVLAGTLMCAIPPPAWYISISPNPFTIFFAFLGLYLLIRDPALKWVTVFASVACFFASFWAKQTGLGFLGAGLFYILIRNVKKGVVALCFAAAVMFVCINHYVSQPGSTFLDAVFLRQGNAPILWGMFIEPFLFPETIGRFGVFLAIILAGLIHEKWSLKVILKPEYIFLGAAALVSLTRLKYGSGSFQCIIFYGMLFICGFLAVSKMFQLKLIHSNIFTAFFLIQCFSLIYNHKPYIIDGEDQSRYQYLLSLVSTPNKSVYYLNNNFFHLLAGKTMYTPVGRDCYNQGVIDRSRYPKKLMDFYSTDPFDIVIIDVPLEDNSWPLYARLDAGYQAVQEIPARQPTTSMLRYRKVILHKKITAANVEKPSP